MLCKTRFHIMKTRRSGKDCWLLSDYKSFQVIATFSSKKEALVRRNFLNRNDTSDPATWVVNREVTVEDRKALAERMGKLLSPYNG